MPTVKNTSGPTRIWESADAKNFNPGGGRPNVCEPAFLNTKVTFDGKTGLELVTTLESFPQIDPEYTGPNNVYASGLSGCTKTNGDTHCESKDFQHMSENHSVNRKDISFNVEYIRLSKESRVWDSQGQYKLANESNRRAECILKGDTKGYEQCLHSNVLYTPTKRFNPKLRSGRAQGSSCFVICEQCKGYSGNHKCECPLNVLNFRKARL